MSSATDSDLRVAAEGALLEAQEILGVPPVVVGLDGGEDYWDAFAKRAKALLDKAKQAHPLVLGAKAGEKIRDAARWGASKASEASDATKATLGTVAAAAGALALGPGILFGLALFLLVEGTGYGARARRAGRRYVSQRAAAYGF